MAWYEITYKCGHTDRIQLYGKETERERRIKAMEQHECPECRAQAAQEEAAAKGLAELKGSPKQISWASDIRSEMLADLDKKIARMEENFARNQGTEKAEKLAQQDGSTVEEFMAKCEAYIDTFRAARQTVAEKTSCRWFIDNQDASAETLASMVKNNQ